MRGPARYVVVGWLPCKGQRYVKWFVARQRRKALVICDVSDTGAPDPCEQCSGRGWKFVHVDGFALHLVDGGAGSSEPQDCLACDGSGVRDAA